MSRFYSPKLAAIGVFRCYQGPCRGNVLSGGKSWQQRD